MQLVHVWLIPDVGASENWLDRRACFLGFDNCTEWYGNGLGGLGAGKGAGRGPAHGYGRVRTCTTTPPNAQCRKTPIHTLKHMQSHKSTHVKPPPKSAKGTIGHPTLPTGWGGHEGVGVTRQRQMVVFGQTEDTCRLLAIYLFFLGILVLGALKKTLNCRWVLGWEGLQMKELINFNSGP